MDARGTRGDLARYIADMEVIYAMLDGARSRSIGIYATNPGTHQLPRFNGLDVDIEALQGEVYEALKLAKERLTSLPVKGE